MLYHLSYGGSTKLFSQNLFTPIWPRIYHELYTNFSKSFQSNMSIIRRVYIFNIYLNNFFCKKRNASTPLEDLSIAGPMLYHLSYGGLNIYWKFHPVLNDVNSKSRVDSVDMVEFGYHGEWCTLLIFDIIDWNNLEKSIYSSWYIRGQIGVNRFCEKSFVEPP